MTSDALKTRVDALFSRWAKSDSPGCAVAILQDDQVVYKQGYGIANLEYNIPITPATVFHVASVSKQFVAAAIALLEGEGKLSSTDDVRKYLPELPDFGDTIQIQHLAHHTSGLRDQWSLLELAGWRMEDVITTGDILELVGALRALNFKPGAEYSYSNTGYTLLGLIVQRVSGQSLRHFCAEHIFAPLGMTSTHFHDDYQEIVPNRTYSYSEKNDVFQHSHLLYSTIGASSLFTTVEDLLGWEQNFFNPRVGDPAFFERMTRRDTLNDGTSLAYTYGLLVRDYRGLRIVEHSGGDAGYRSHLIQFPDQRFAVVVLANLASIQPGQLALQIADLFLADAFTKPGEPGVFLPVVQLEPRAGFYYSPVRHETLQLSYDADHQALTLHSQPLEVLGEQRFRVGSTLLSFEDRLMIMADGIGQPNIYERIEPITLSAEALAAYEGVYSALELDVKYVIAIEDSGLVLRRRKYGTASLLPLFADAFVETNMEYDVLFKRDDDDVISGFELSTGRVRDLWFKREPDLNSLD